MESWLVGDISVRIAGVDLGLHDAVAITRPAPFAGWGVGGFLSPQHLHPTAIAVIDLRADRLILLDGNDEAIDAWLGERMFDLISQRLDRDPDEQTPVVRATIEPFAPAATMLNTGGRGTEFAVAAVPGLAGVAPDEIGKGVGGDPVLGSVVADRMLRVGDVRLPVPRLLVRDRIDTMVGLVGMDVLRGTVVALGADRRRPVWWLVPRDQGH